MSELSRGQVHKSAGTFTRPLAVLSHQGLVTFSGRKYTSVYVSRDTRAHAYVDSSRVVCDGRNEHRSCSAS